MNKLLFVFAFSLSATIGFSQSLTPTVVGSTGGSGTSAAGNVDWTVGEIMTETFSSGNILTQGFHQPLQSITTSLNSNTFNGFNIYPNPVSSQLYINFTDAAAGNYNYQLDLFDAQGKKVLSKLCSSGSVQEVLSLEQLKSGVYFLNIYIRGSTSKQSFTINKI